MKTKRICAVTGSRAEFGVFSHTLRQLASAPQLTFQLVVTGMHLSREFGYTMDEILDYGFHPTETVEMMLSSDTNVGMGKSIGLGIISMTDCLSRLAPDLLLVIGDRYETFAAATAAMALNIPIAHISGGEITEGAIDEQMRHAITKMSHLHFVTLEENARIVKQMGEESWRVHVVGGPWIDNIKTLEDIPKEELSKRLGLDLGKPTILVTFHSVTLQLDETKKQIDNLLTALAKTRMQTIFTYPNADAGGRIIIEAIKQFCAQYPKAIACQSLGSKMYLNMLRHVCLMVGNSSSGMMETQSFRLPVVNIGSRQKGRMATDNIINCPPEADAIYDAIITGLSPEFRDKATKMKNPYDSGGVAENILSVLADLPDKATLLNKKFSS